MHRHTISFAHAADGIGHPLKTQPNFLVPVSISAMAIILGFELGLATWEWVTVIATISIGLVIELINTAIESTVDLVTHDVRPLAKIAKDCASGAMLVYAVGASVVGLVIFLPKLWLFF